ncbi:MAG: hypothetical protein K1X39_14805, partial [Thermoflexales bacterium]|nr:hypothetical protein [Thermoflexales bacterium]
MGKQVNFYAMPDDINTLVEYVLTKKGGYCISMEAGKGRTPTVKQFGMPLMRDKNRDPLLIRSGDLGALKFERHPRFGTWQVDRWRSLAIECTFIVPLDGDLRCSRLWFQTDVVTSEFVAWADSVNRWVRSHFERVPIWRGREYLEYVGPAAKRLLDAGAITLIAKGR